MAHPLPPGPGPLTLPSAVLTPRYPEGSPGGAASPGAVADPDERRLARVAIPAAVLAGITGAALVAILLVMLVVGAATATIVAAVLLAAGTAALGATAVRAGILGRPGRPAPARWESPRAWIGPLGTSDGRALIGRACQAAERIATNPAWWSADLDDHRLTVDLAAELEQIDGQAYALAARAVRSGGVPDPASPHTALPDTAHPNTAPLNTAPLNTAPLNTAPLNTAPPAAVDPEWAALVAHVSALEDYADRIERYSAPGQRLPALPLPGGSLAYPPAPDPEVSAAGAARDEFATAHLRRLNADLGSRDRH